MSIPCIASIDQGTSSTRVLIVSSQGRVLCSHQVEHSQFYPASGQVEHDPLEIWKNVQLCLSMCFKKFLAEIEIVGIGITNQRETTVVWNKETGKPYHKAIVWNDTRTSQICDELLGKYSSKDYFREKTGLPIATYFSATKLMYLLQTNPELRKDANSGKALFGTIDSWLIWKLTNGKIHATDVTNASRTLLMNIKTLSWDEDILNEFQIPRIMLPDIFPSSHLYGYVTISKNNTFEEPKVHSEDISCYHNFQDIPITGVIGDQNAALFGQACFHKGDAKCTYGTGAFLFLNTGEEIVKSKHGLLTTVAYQLNPKINPKPIYALEGSIAYSGSVLQWLRDNLGIISSAAETEAIALSVPDNGGVYFVPAFAGLYAPYWRRDARGLIVGLTAFNTKAHIVRAALEASAYQTIEIVKAMKEDSGEEMSIKSLKVDGGLSVNNFLMQFLCDLLDIPLLRPKISETTAMGAAFISGLGVGLWKNLDEIEVLWRSNAQWQPKMQPKTRAKLIYHWQKSLARSLHWKNEAHFDELGQLTSSDPHLLDPLMTHLYLPAKEKRITPEIHQTIPAINKPTVNLSQISKFENIFLKKNGKFVAFLGIGLGFATGFISAKYFLS